MLADVLNINSRLVNDNIFYTLEDFATSSGEVNYCGN